MSCNFFMFSYLMIRLLVNPLIVDLGGIKA